MTLQSAHTYADIKPSVSPLINFRLEADVVLGGVLADSASIDFVVKWGKTAGGGRLSNAYFTHARTGGTNNLLCSTNVNGRGTLSAPTTSGAPGAYTFVVQRLSGEVKLFVNGTDVLTAPFISAEPADAELYIEIGLAMPLARPANSVSAVRLLGSQPVLAGAFWTTLIGATETP